jgi:hypothetical protein
MGAGDTMSSEARQKTQRAGRNARVGCGGRLSGSPVVHRYGWIGREIQRAKIQLARNVDDRRAGAKAEAQRRLSNLGRYADEKT